RKKNIVLTVTFIFGEAAALAVVLAVLVMFVQISLSGSYEVLVRTNLHGEHYVELALLCVIEVLVTVDLICRFARLRREVVREHGR
ncbi:unnamed protein product, partial [marine sediment metagenome]